MEKENKFLMSIETVKIKDFIFNTNKLKAIRGASFLLDYLNQVVVKKILEENDVKETDILYIAAGNAKFYCKSEKIAKKIEEEVREEYRKLAPDSKLAISYICAKGLNLGEAIDKLAKETNTVKNRGFSRLNFDLPFVEKCGICCDNPVEIKKENYDSHLTDYIKHFTPYLKKEDINERIETKKDKHKIKNQLFDDVSGVCPSCFAKYISANLIKDDLSEIGFYHKFKEKFKGVYKPIESLEDLKLNKSFIGFVYSDGDAVGEFLKNSKDAFKDEKDDKKYFEFIQKFSKTLDKYTKDSLIEVLEELRNENKIDEHFGEFLIVGGDDVCAIFPGDIAIEVSVRFQKKFNEKMKAFAEKCAKDYKFKINGSNITSSGGVIIAKSKTPLYYLFDLSLQLQKNAKKKRYETYDGKTPEFKNGFIDFQVIGAEGTVDIDDFRNGIKNLIQRPYSIEKNEDVRNIDSLFEFIKELKKVGFPKNKLRKYYDLKAEIESNPNKSLKNLFEIINTITKLDTAQKDFIINWMGKDKISECNEETLKEIFNDIFDVLELYDFVGGGNDDN